MLSIRPNKPIPFRERTTKDPSRDQMALEIALTEVCPDMKVYENYKDPEWGLPGRMDVDIYIPDEKIAVEYDSYEYHNGRQRLEQYKNDILERNGIHIIRVREGGLPDLRGGDTQWFRGDDYHSKTRAMERTVKYVADSHKETHRTRLQSTKGIFRRMIGRMVMDNVHARKINLGRLRTQASWDVANTDAMTEGDVKRIRRAARYDQMSPFEKQMFESRYERKYREREKDAGQERDGI